jgi:hypothetical protein
MDSSVATIAADTHRLIGEIQTAGQAKAHLTVGENRDFRSEIGRALARAFALAGWTTVKEAAAQINRERAQVSRWIAGTERPQFDALFNVPALREPLCVALAELADADVRTTIEFRRSRRA